MRLFVAIDVPEAVRRALGDVIGRLRTESRGVKWVRPEAMHLTLKFIGEIEAKQVDSIRAALQSVHSNEPVELTFRALGFFPNERRPRVIWCGIASSPNLVQLASDVDRALKTAGIPPETREFVPHLTLGRFPMDRGGHGKSDKLLRAAEELKSHDFGSTHEAEFHLIRSQLKTTSAEYTKLESYSIVQSAS